MYIEQGYKSTPGLWKFFVLPIGFIGFMLLNYIATLMSNMDVEASMAMLIDKLGKNITLIFLLAPLVVGLFVVLGWVLLVHGQSITALTTSRKKIDWKRVFFAFGVWGTLTVILTMTDIFMSPEDYVFTFQLNKFIPMAVIAILLVPLQTSFEEYLFRAHMMQGLGLLAKNRWVPLFTTSIIFGLMHIANPEVGKLGMGIMVYYIGTGFFLGILTLMDEGLELALGFHAANNLISALLLTAEWTAFQTDSIYTDVSEPILGWDVLVPVLVIFPILLALFGKIYNWKNWKEKLFGRILTKEEFFAKENATTS
ncbi:CAAX protease family protein [Croceivirga radicis]|uniref:CAAX protease family protein n=1 Tax=Croceivirga radicis TaxID=1929488 RepID=A0A1V6LS37_9FLAO|nr:CPBP family intramembrane glutamic endopeptidase [Croceivirga radicis]OQD42994.1 CAAX protease family protein [Croceivirga radicis]